jgi:hypothetical protein
VVGKQEEGAVSVPYSWHYVPCPACGAKAGSPCMTDELGLYGWCNARIDATDTKAG